MTAAHVRSSDGILCYFSWMPYLLEDMVMVVSTVTFFVASHTSSPMILLKEAGEGL